MDISYLCVLIAAVFPYYFAGYSKLAGKGFDNRNPRDYEDKLEGKAKRALGAQRNSFEAFPAFAAAVIAGHLSGLGSGPLTALAVAFIIFRVVYGYCYIADKPTFRSIMWFGGFVCVVTLFLLVIFKH